MGFLMSPGPLTNFELQKYYKNELRFNGVFSRWGICNKCWWICRCRHTLLYFVTEMKLFILIALVLNIFRKKFIDCRSLSSSVSPNENIKANIFRVQANVSVMSEYFCIGFIDFMFAGKKYLHKLYKWLCKFVFSAWF